MKKGKRVLLGHLESYSGEALTEMSQVSMIEIICHSTYRSSLAWYLKWLFLTTAHNAGV